MCHGAIEVNKYILCATGLSIEVNKTDKNLIVQGVHIVGRQVIRVA